MNGRRTTVVVVTCLLLLLGTVRLHALMLGPGKYIGTVIFDRWGGCTLDGGIACMYISEKIKDEIRQYEGKSIAIDALEVFQPTNPGDGMITKFKYLGPAEPAKESARSIDGVTLTAEPASNNGEKPTIAITLTNSADKPITLRTYEAHPTLLKKFTGTHDRVFPMEAFDGPSVLWVDGESLSNDHSVRRTGEWKLDAVAPKSFTLNPGEKLTVRISFNLEEGEYDFLAGYGGGLWVGKAAVSNLLAFDVDKTGKATFVKIKGR